MLTSGCALAVVAVPAGLRFEPRLMYLSALQVLEPPWTSYKICRPCDTYSLQYNFSYQIVLRPPGS